MNPMIYVGLKEAKQKSFANKRREITDEEIFKAIKAALFVTDEDIKGKCRGRDESDARFIFLGIKKEYGSYMPLKALGKMLNRDHSTIIYGYDAFKELTDEKTGDEKFLMKVNSVKFHLKIK